MSRSADPGTGLRPVATSVHQLVRVGDGTADGLALADGARGPLSTVLRHRVRRDADGPRLAFGTWHNRLGRPAGLPNPLELRAEMRLHHAGTGVVVDVTFDGSPVAIVGGGAVVLSDPVPVRLVAGEAVTTCTVVCAPGGGVLPLGPRTDATRGEAVAWGDHRGRPVAPSAGYGYGPWLLLGATRRPTDPLVLVTGDSNAVGFGDRRGTADHDGWVRRALETGADADVVNLAVSGATARDARRSDGMIADLLGQLQGSRPTVAIAGLGTNDLRGGGVSADEMTARLTAHWRHLAEATPEVVACTIPPATTSSDGWASTAGQRPDPGHETRRAVNDWIRRLPEPLSGVLDLAGAVEPVSGLWAPGSTDDGVHLSPAGHAAVAVTAGRWWAERTDPGRTRSECVV